MNRRLLTLLAAGLALLALWPLLQLLSHGLQGLQQAREREAARAREEARDIGEI